MEVLRILHVVAAILFPIVSLAGPIPLCGNKVGRWAITREAPEIKYYIESTDANFISSVESAFGAWDDVETSFISPTRTENTNEAPIKVRIGRPKNLGAAGEAWVKVDNECRFVSCDLIITASAASDQRTIRHEGGHCLGLNHSVVRGAIMSYAINKNGVMTTDDELMISMLYPEDPSAQLPVGCATTRATSSAMPNIGFLIATVALLSVLLPLRFKSKLHNSR